MESPISSTRGSPGISGAGARTGSAAFLAGAKTPFALAARAYAWHEAGPFGYGRQRELTRLGATNHVTRPRDWDEDGQQVKTDWRDARCLVLELDRQVAGNHDAFCVVRVPTSAAEPARRVSRARQSLQEEKPRLAAQGRSTALDNGHRREGEWFAPALWQDLAPTLLPSGQQVLAPLPRLMAAVEQELTALTSQVEAAAPAGRWAATRGCARARTPRANAAAKGRSTSTATHGYEPRSSN